MKTKMLGSTTKCPRCEGPKPAGDCGQGISLSRRGKAALCSHCGTEEAFYDYSKIHGESIPWYIQEDEDRLIALLKKNKVLK